MPAPSYRRGAMKAALEAQLVEQRAKRELEKTQPVEAQSVRELAEKLLERSLRVLEKDLAEDDPRTRSEAAKAIGVISVNYLKNEKEPEQPTITAEERAARLAAAEASPEVRAYLESRGWKPPER